MALQSAHPPHPTEDDIRNRQTAAPASGSLGRWHEPFIDIGMHTLSLRFAGGIAFYSMLPIIGSVVAWLIGGMVLLGWTLNVPDLYTLVPGGPAVVPASATGLIVSGSALWLLRYPDAGTRTRWGGWFLAVCTGVLGILMLAEHHFHVSLGIDQLLFSTALAHYHGMAGVVPGRMSANTSLNFVLIAIALLTLDVTIQRVWHPAHIMATMSLLIALVGMIGSVYGVSNVYHVIGYHTMSFPTATAFAALGIGVLLARRKHGIPSILVSDGAAGVAARLLIPVAVLLPLAVGGLALAGVRARLFGPAFGASLAVIAVTFTLVALVTWNAHQLHALDAIRQRYADDLGMRMQESQALAEELEEANSFLRAANQRASMAPSADQATANPTPPLVPDPASKSHVPAQ